MNYKEVKVYVFGSFDGLHPGHISFLKQAKKLGHLTVVVARDSNIVVRKKQAPLFSEKKRKQTLTKLNIADEVILGQEGVKFDLLATKNIDVICLGYDQMKDLSFLREKLQKIGRNHIKIVRAKPFLPLILKSSKLKRLGLIREYDD
ncbi:adenylyltransferase/cytidyltransferase family protein [Candidatus Berkelbacteria bacterium]|nr:adenylyltransferase/cytidyltransferase family protein [Candidatus Berkelbacteria bacterium]